MDQYQKEIKNFQKRTDRNSFEPCYFKKTFAPSGFIKIHEHDGKRPQALGILSTTD
jgi:hypothetical protein